MFPSVTLRNPEKLKCESFMLRERRGQQASQLGKKQQACFISEADGESFTAPHSLSRGLCPADNGALREGWGGHKHKFSDCYKSFIFHGSRLTLEKAFHPRLLTVCTQGLAWTLAVFSTRQCTSCVTSDDETSCLTLQAANCTG